MSVPCSIPRRALSALLLGALCLCATAVQVDQRPALGAPLAQAGQAPLPQAGSTAPARKDLAPASSHTFAPGLRPAPSAVRPAAPGWSRAGRSGETLAQARALFLRADVDVSGRLGVREADHAGIDALLLARSDINADGLLDADEFNVARQRALELLGRAVAADLIAESIRIQALWRARAGQAERSAGTKGPALTAPPPSATPVGLPPVGAPGRDASAPPAGPGQARLSAAVDSSAALTAERARRAQILLELRRRARVPDQD